MRICVFCGSSCGARPAYEAAAKQLGELLAARGIGLVFGGGCIGASEKGCGRSGRRLEVVVQAGFEASIRNRLNCSYK